MKNPLNMLIFFLFSGFFILAFAAMGLVGDNRELLGQLSQCQQSLLEEVAQ